MPDCTRVGRWLPSHPLAPLLPAGSASRNLLKILLFLLVWNLLICCVHPRSHRGLHRKPVRRDRHGAERVRWPVARDGTVRARHAARLQGEAPTSKNEGV